MATTPVTGAGTTTATTAAEAAETAKSRAVAQKLDQDDFIKLLVAQLTTQDPLNPQKDTEFIGQMAQFSALETSKTMSADLQSLRVQQELLQANSMIGREVVLNGANDVPAAGTVSAVRIVDGQAQLIVNNEAHLISDVVSISPAATK